MEEFTEEEPSSHVLLSHAGTLHHIKHLASTVRVVGITLCILKIFVMT